MAGLDVSTGFGVAASGGVIFAGVFLDGLFTTEVVVAVLELEPNDFSLLKSFGSPFVFLVFTAFVAVVFFATVSVLGV